MKELKFDDLQEINGGLGGGPSSNHPKPSRKMAKCLASVGLSVASGWGTWRSIPAGLAALMNC